MTNSHGRMAAKSAERLGMATSTRKAGKFQRKGSAALRLGSPSSPGPVAYAGSKWGESPAPAALPRPPTHWTRPEPKMLLSVSA